MNGLTEANNRPDTVNHVDRTRTRPSSRGIAAHRFFASYRLNVATVALISLIGSGLLAARWAAAQDVPSGTIELSGGSMAAGVGYTWGSGKLVFEGKEYPLTVSGISLGAAGISTYNATGAVYHLTKLSDFNGVYTAVSPRSSLAEGAQTVAIKNPNGVVIQMAATHAGMAFSLGPNGATIEMK